MQPFCLTNVKRENYKIATLFLQVRGAERGCRRWEALRCCDVLRVSRCQRLTGVEGVRHKGLTHTHTKTIHEDVGMSSIRADPSYITCNSYSSAAFTVPSLKLHIGGFTFFLHSERIMIFFPLKSDLSCSSPQHNSSSWMGLCALHRDALSLASKSSLSTIKGSAKWNSIM